MSNNQIRIPTNVGYTETTPLWKPASQHIYETVSEYIKDAKHVYFDTARSSHQNKLAKVITFNDKSFFIKILDSRDPIVNEFEKDITKALSVKEVNVSRLLEYADLDCQKQILIYQYIDDTDNITSTMQVDNCSVQLAQLHIALRNMKNQDFTLEATDKRHLWLKSSLNSMPANYLGNIFNKYKPEMFDYFLNNRQLLHGDLNRGNIIFQDSKMFFIDFEESYRNFYNPIIDVAFFLERLVIMLEKDLTLSSSKIKRFLEIYNHWTGNNYSDIDVYRTLELLSIRALVIINENVRYWSQEVVEQETNKFVYTLRQALQLKEKSA